jgi:hypothetical protein
MNFLSQAQFAVVCGRLGHTVNNMTDNSTQAMSADTTTCKIVQEKDFTQEADKKVQLTTKY